MIDETQRRDPPIPVRKELYSPGYINPPRKLGGPPRPREPYRKPALSPEKPVTKESKPIRRTTSPQR